MDNSLTGLIGWADSHDRAWWIHTPNFKAKITDYNWELTGYDPRLSEIDPEIFHYGGNAYYITGSYAESKGWTVERIPRKLPD